MNVQTSPRSPVVPGPDGRNRRAFTTDDVFAMIDAGIIGRDERIELIDGEIIPMNAEAARHLKLRSAIAGEVFTALHRTHFVTSDGTYRLSPRTFVEPDIHVLPRDVDAATAGGPDALLVIEVGDTTLKSDLTAKAALYARHGVRELWVIDAESLVTHVHREPAEDGSYGSITLVPSSKPLTPHLIEGLTLRLDDLRDRL
jgi:Uma2 family endonuclease